MACICGHLEEDHKQGFDNSCTVHDEDTSDNLCPCAGYEEDEDDQ